MSQVNTQLDINLVVCLANELNALKLENERLNLKLAELTKDKEILQNIILNKDKTIEELKNENQKLNERINELENNMQMLKTQNIKLNDSITILNNKNIKFDALVKLNECNTIVNNNFKKEYRKYFKLKRTEHTPNISELINEPPNKYTETELFEFWNYFLEKYPKSDSVEFRKIYHNISNDRASNGAHINVNTLTKNEFDELIKIIYPIEYENNKELYDSYRDWLFMFPLC